MSPTSSHPQGTGGPLPQVENHWFIQLFWHHPFTIKLSWHLFQNIIIVYVWLFFLFYLLLLWSTCPYYPSTAVFIVLKSGSIKCFNSILPFQDFLHLTRVNSEIFQKNISSSSCFIDFLGFPENPVMSLATKHTFTSFFPIRVSFIVLSFYWNSN